MKIRSKLPEVETSIFTTMTKLALDNNSINMSQGFPDFEVNSKIIDLVEKYMRSGYNQYSPMQGVEILREKIALKTELSYNLRVNPFSEVTVTSGATEAIFCAISSVINRGDEVIIFDPAFDCYSPIVKLNGGKVIHIPMDFPSYKINWNRVNDSISTNTKMLIINSPHNPTGTVISLKDINALREIILDKEIIILSDEVYEHIIFDNLIHHSILKYPDLAEKAFVISSFGKTYHTTGWKIGYCIAPKNFTEEFRKVHQFVTFASNTPIQYAYADILDNESLYLDLGLFYEKKRDYFIDSLKNSRFKILDCKGTYFQTLDYSEISNLSDIEFAFELTTKCGITGIPPSVFYDNKEDNRVLRFCFAKKDETLKQAAEILCGI